MTKQRNLVDTSGKNAIPAPTLKERGSHALKKAGKFARKNKAALIAGGVGAAGIAGASVASHAIGKRKGRNE